MDDFELDQARIAAANPSTRTLISLGSIWLGLSVALCTLANIIEAMAPLGIDTHPPTAWFVIAYLLAILSALIGGYAWGYTSRARTRFRHWSRILTAAALYGALSFSAVAWAVPAVTTLYAPNPATPVLVVQGTSDLSRARMGCHTRAYFGIISAPAGNICMDQISRHVRAGWRLQLEGNGNVWATRITTFKGMAPQ